jgi:tetratricopeptide (TPR) repeat protein
MNIAKHLRIVLASWFGIALFAIFLLAILGICLTCDFVSLDDHVNVQGNVWMGRPLGEALGRFWRAPYENLYIPFAYTVWWFVAAVSRSFHSLGFVGQALDPMIFHGLNLCLHTGNTLLVLSILTVLLKGRRFLALIGAAIFALSPVQVEALTWISCLRDLLAAFLSLVAIRLLLRRDISQFLLFLATLAACLAMLSKPNAMVLPLVAAIILAGAGRINERRRITLLGFWMILALPMIVINKSQQLDGGLQFVPDFWQRPIIAWDAIGSYLKIIFWPFDLTPDYGRSPAMVIGHAMSVWRVILPLIPFAFIYIGRDRKNLCLAYALFLTALLPTLGFIPFQYQEFSTVADRYAYIAMIGVAWFLCIFLDALASLRLQPILAFGVCLGLSILSRQQIARWKDSETLYRHALELNSRSKIIAFSMGNLRYQAGRYDEAESYFKIVKEEWPALADVHLNLAVVYAASQRFDEALKEVDETLRLSPKEGNALHLRGMILYHLNQHTEAVQTFRSHLALRPSGVIALFSSAMVALLERDYDRAERGFLQVLKDQPDNRSAMVQLMNIQQELARAARLDGRSQEAEGFP